MHLRMWWWREIRKAGISKNDRDIFERYGEFVIGNVLAGGLQPPVGELQKLYRDMGPKHKDAADWLTERGDSKEQQEQRMETVEWAVLIFVLAGVVVEGLQLLRDLGCLHGS
jgi:hypothetical protein